jgi:uncharacterized cupredoxin-like copper-binding protein
MALRHFAAAAVGGALLLSATAASAATIVNVELWDSGAAATMMTGLAYTGAGAVDTSKATMGIKVSQASAPQGVVTFKVTNSSKDTVHEMIVVYLKDPATPPPYSAGDQRIDEDKAGYKGEVSELEPGKSGSKTLALKPGKYLLVCNIAGHYAAGMWTEFDVTK